MIKGKKAMASGSWILVIVLVALIGAAIYYTSTNSMKSQDGEGRVLIAMTDAAANMGTISEVRITVDKVEAHSEGQGWVTLSSNSQTYDLLELKAKGEVVAIADEEIKADNYNQIRMEVSKVVVVDANGSHEAKLPSNRLTVNTQMTVDEESTQTATFDFIADESLHVTGNGRYIMAPVISIETRDDAEIKEESGGRVVISGGRVMSTSKVGMDINGNVGVGLGVSSDINIDVNENLVIGGVIGAGSSSGKNNSSSGGVGLGLGSSASTY
ncbi:MAG: DUF4382 domain-containing protein [Nanoarchaeota archaeon]